MNGDLTWQQEERTYLLCFRIHAVDRKRGCMNGAGCIFPRPVDPEAHRLFSGNADRATAGNTEVTVVGECLYELLICESNEPTSAAAKGYDPADTSIDPCQGFFNPESFW